MGKGNVMRVVAHYKKLGIKRAWCGITPMLSFDEWPRVTCETCLERGRLVHEWLP